MTCKEKNCDAMPQFFIYYKTMKKHSHKFV